MPDRRERNRRLVHFAFGFCALLVPELGRAGSIAVAGTACAYNLLIAPALRWDRAYRRPDEARAGGLATYPLAVLLLLLVAPLPAAMAAWGVLAAGDPAAAVAGMRWPRPAIPWNRRKSFAGTAAGLVAGSLAAALLLVSAGAPRVAAPALAAGAAGALAESFPWPIDDNLPVAAAAAAGLVLFGV